MAIGATLFAIAMIDRLIRIVMGGSYELGGGGATSATEDR
jgi:hypothetical protein